MAGRCLVLALRSAEKLAGTNLGSVFAYFKMAQWSGSVNVWHGMQNVVMYGHLGQFSSAWQKDWFQPADKRQSRFGLMELWLVSHMDFWLPTAQGNWLKEWYSL